MLRIGRAAMAPLSTGGAQRPFRTPFFDCSTLFVDLAVVFRGCTSYRDTNYQMWLERSHVAEWGAFGDRLGKAFGLADAPVLKMQTLRKTQLAVTQIRYDGCGFGVTEPIPREDAYLVALQVRECPDHGLWVDGRDVPCVPIVPGVTMIYDLRQVPIARMKSPFHSLHFYLPRRALNELADEFEAPRIDELRFRHGDCMNDPVVGNLMAALLPALARPDQISSLFADHVTMALRAHIAQTYGGMRLARRPFRGGLVAWQQRRVEALLDSHLDGEITLDRLAQECGLSVSHFARAFRKTNGTSPHRWLVGRRVAKAKDLLHNSTTPLSEIALACGFADQSHFTRVFTKMVGISPGASRRSHRR